MRFTRTRLCRSLYAATSNVGPKPLVELRKALKNVQDEVVQDATMVAVLVLYKALVKNAETYGEWAG
jgi:hypothetical protein